MRSAPIAVLAALCAASALPGQTPPEPPPSPAAEPPATPAASARPTSPAAAREPEPPAVPDEDARERIVGPTEGAPTMSLAAAVRLALEKNFSLLGSVDAVETARWQEKAAFGEFLPTVTPLFQRSSDSYVFGVDVAQKLPWSGGTLSASGRYTSQPSASTPFPKTTDVRLLLTQPILRGVGPNATYFDLTNARRARQGQERSLSLAQQKLAVDVASAFYAVVAQRQLLDVARQSLQRTEALLKSSKARLEVGLASKIDVFRAELQAAQGRDAMVRSQAALATALERFRGLLSIPPDDPVEPEAAPLPDTRDEFEPVQALVLRALQARLELTEARDQVSDARRAASLATQNLLPQLDLNVAVTQLGYGGTLGDTWSAADRRVEFFVSASYPFQQTSLRSTRAIAEIEVGTRERTVRQTELDVEQQVRQALRDLDQIRKSVELQRQAVEVAAQQRRLAVLRYQRGLGSNFDVVDSESSLVTARSALVQLLTTYAVARLDLKRTTGTLDVFAEFAP
ncbi:MAG TPA: TolC family protein [Vicinamibacteria bacterium]|nr:TolC family protein [Vicinamibacteria bacterium]